MLRLKISLILSLFLSTLGLGQTLLNGYGLGSVQYTRDAASLGISSTGLLPSFRPHVSVSNPSTWRVLQYTYLSGMYGGHEVEQKNNTLIHGRSDLDQFQLIIPIKQKYAWGIGINPYSDQRISLIGSETTTVFGLDTLTVRNTISGFGGINSFNTSFGFPISEKDILGVTFDFLFGSSRQEAILTVDQKDYIYEQRRLYSGVLLKIFIQSDRLKIKKIPIDTYLALGFSAKPLAIKIYSYQPFEDNNGSGYHDASSINRDFPDLASNPKPIKTYYSNSFHPIELQFGLDSEIATRLHFQTEVAFWKDLASFKHNLSALHDQISSRNQLNVGLVKFSTKVPHEIWNRFHYRTGIYIRQIKLDYSQKYVNQYGVSFGIGYKFGLTNNQIDFGFSISKRDGLIKDGEIIRQFSVGLSIGDLWFVKRRER